MLNEKELATVLAALRYWQQGLKNGPPPAQFDDHFTMTKALTSEEIDVLCERINVKDIRPEIVDAFEKCLTWLGNIGDYGPELLTKTMPNDFGRPVVRALIQKLGGGRAVSYPSYKEFKVASISANLNEFCLRGMILVARDGEAWEVAANNLNEKKKGEIVTVMLDRDTRRPMFERLQFEAPESRGTCPSSVLAEIWNDKPAPVGSLMQMSGGVLTKIGDIVEKKEEKPCPPKKSSSSSEPTGRPPSRSSRPSAPARKSRKASKKAGR